MTEEDRERVALAEGTVIDGRYRIESELGRGGFARVYKASHTDLERGAALKVIELPQRPGAVDLFIERFLREARIAANLSHPNVVTVYDYGVIEHTGQPYLAMELLDGWDLEMVLAHHGSMEPTRAVKLMIEVLDALAEAQSTGIVHKDLKPSNLFMVGEGTVRERLVLIDFGIARIWDDEGSRITQTGGFTGTPAYFAPEYVEHQIVTPAIDVYQCALILVEMMTSVPAVVAENSMQYLLKHCAGEVDVPDELIASPLGPVLQKALATNHMQRYPDCAAFRDALAAIDASQIPAPRSAPTGPVVRHNTLETTPQTDEFADSMASGETLAAPGNDAFSDEVALPPPPRPSRPLIPIVAGIAFVGMLAVGAAIVHEDPSEPPDPAVVTKTEDPSPTTPPVVAHPEPDPVEPEPIAPEVAEPDPAPQKPATIETVPPRAVLAIDGVRYGQTPVDVAGELLAGETHVLTLTRRGYKTHRAEVTFEPGETLSFELQPKRRPIKKALKKQQQRRQNKKQGKTPPSFAP